MLRFGTTESPVRKSINHWSSTMKNALVAMAVAGMAATSLFGSAAAKVGLQDTIPGVAVEGSELLVALPIRNAGDTTAFRVTVTDIELRGGRLDRRPLPAQLRTPPPDA